MIPPYKQKITKLPAVREIGARSFGSTLSAGTRNAPGFDQAARNVACMAHMLGRAGIEPNTVECLAFYVIAPQAQIEAGVFGNLVTKDSIEAKVRQRVASYMGQHDRWLGQAFLPTLAKIELSILSWESILAAMPQTDHTQSIRAFYAQCLQFNPLRTRL